MSRPRLLKYDLLAHELYKPYVMQQICHHYVIELFLRTYERWRKLYCQNLCQSCFSSVYFVFEVFQEREFEEMLAISYLVLKACISFLRCSRQKWRSSYFALFASKCHCSLIYIYVYIYMCKNFEMHCNFFRGPCLEAAVLWPSLGSPVK